MSSITCRLGRRLVDPAACQLDLSAPVLPSTAISGTHELPEAHAETGPLFLIVTMPSLRLTMLVLERLETGLVHR